MINNMARQLPFYFESGQFATRGLRLHTTNVVMGLNAAFLTRICRRFKILLHWLEKQTNLYKMPILEKLEVHSF